MGAAVGVETLALGQPHPPLYATETNAPDCQDARRATPLRSTAAWVPIASEGGVVCHSPEFGQHFVDEGVNIGNASHGAGDVLAGRTAVPMFGPQCFG